MTRHFLNTPMLRDFDDVEAFAEHLGALAIRGYTGPDGSHRAILEITAEAADKARVRAGEGRLSCEE